MGDMRPTLRPVQETDIEDYVRWLNDPEVIQYMSIEVGDVTLEGERKWYARIMDPDNASVYFAIDVGGKHIGNCAVKALEGEGQVGLGMFIGDKSEWGKGYGGVVSDELLRIAFEERGAHRARCLVQSTNGAILRIAEKSGLRREGVHREAARKGGEWVDVVCLAILEHEWRERH